MTDQVSDDNVQEDATDQTPSKPTVQDGGEEFDKDRAMATIKKLREFEKTAKAQLKELDDLKAAQKAADDAKLSENERTQRRLSELEQSIATQKAEAEAKIAEAEAKRQAVESELASERRASRVAKVAAGLGAHDPHDANILAATADIDATGDKAEEQIKQAIERLREARPYLFKRAGGSLEPFNPGNADGRVRTDAQIVNDLRSTAQKGKSPFG